VERAPEEPAGAFVDLSRKDFHLSVFIRPRQGFGGHGRFPDFTE
jgi:hypothetical protein